MNQLSRTDPVEYSFGDYISEQAPGQDIQPRNPKKKRTQPYLAPALEPRHNQKSVLPVAQPKQRSSSNERPAGVGSTLDRIFGGNFKVVDVFNTMRDSSEEHFPEDPLTRRLSPRKQNNFEIAEADEEEEDLKESRRGNRETSDKKLSFFAEIPEPKGSFPSFLQPKITKSTTLANLEGTKSPFDDREITLRASRVKFYPRQNDEPLVGNKPASTSELLLAQMINQTGSSGIAQKKKVDPKKSRANLQSSYNQHNSSFHGRQASKINSDSNFLPPINLGNTFTRVFRIK